MAMFGKSGPGWGDTLSTIGAVLTDVGSGEGPRYTMALANQRKEAMKQARAMEAQKQLMGLFGGQAAASGGGGMGGIPNIADPRVAQAIIAAEGAGADVGTLLEIMKAGRPEFAVDSGSGEAYNKYDPSMAGRRFARPEAVNDVIVDISDPMNRERHIPKLGEGMTYQRDATGRAVGVQNAPGYVDALSQATGAKAGAEAAARSPYEFQTFTGPQGQSITGARSALAGQVFQGQTPADKIAAEGAATSRVEGQKNLGGALQAATNALDVISQIRNHPGFGSRVGFAAVLPALPNTAGKDFDLLVEQAKGQAFLTAFESLKGGGQITEREGQAAQAAIARLNQAQTKEGFTKALDDLEKIIRTGADRARSKAGVARPSREQALEELRRRGLAK